MVELPSQCVRPDASTRTPSPVHRARLVLDCQPAAGSGVGRRDTARHHARDRDRRRVGTATTPMARTTWSSASRDSRCTRRSRAFVDRIGMTPAEALRTATLDPAKFLGVTDSLGTVSAGKLADLVLLDADPLTDVPQCAPDRRRDSERSLSRRRGADCDARGESSVELGEHGLQNAARDVAEAKAVGSIAHDRTLLAAIARAVVDVPR